MDSDVYCDIVPPPWVNAVALRCDEATGEVMNPNAFADAAAADDVDDSAEEDESDVRWPLRRPDALSEFKSSLGKKSPPAALALFPCDVLAEELEDWLREFLPPTTLRNDTPYCDSINGKMRTLLWASKAEHSAAAECERVEMACSKCNTEARCSGVASS